MTALPFGIAFMPFHTHTLANGLQIIGESLPGSRSASLGFFVNTGARDETAVESGVSHFLEHMAFKGTPRRTALDVNLHFDRIGASPNAYTGEESTVYYASVLPEYLADRDPGSDSPMICSPLASVCV
jgi:predicted Zn-dependent peptidase